MLDSATTNGTPCAPAGYPADKIDRIKEVRRQTGAGLKEAKEAVERANGHLDEAIRLVHRETPQSRPATDVDQAGLARLATVVCQHTGCDLATARDALTASQCELHLAVTKVRLSLMGSLSTILVFGGSWGNCPVCRRHRFLKNVVLHGPDGAADGRCCWNCVRRVSDHQQLLAAFPFHHGQSHSTNRP